MADPGAPEEDPTSCTAAAGFRDADGDGFGDPAEQVTACDLPPDVVSDGTDCDDTDADVFPGAPERCGVEADCDPETRMVAEYGDEAFATLADAVGAAPADGTVEVCAGFHTAVNVQVGRDLVLTAPFGPATLDAGGRGSVLIVQAGRLEVEALSITGASDTAIRASASAAVSLSGCELFDNDGPDGGALFGWDLEVRDSELRNNHTRGDGGAIHVPEGGALVLERTSLADNVSDGNGGAVAMWPGPTTSFVDVTFEENEALGGDGGGAWLYGEGASLALVRTTFAGNVTFGDGGGLYLSGVSVTAGDAVIEANTAFDDGGGASLVARGHDVSWEGGTFADNVSVSAGGGLYSLLTTSAGSVLVSGVTFEDNVATLTGGGLYLLGGPSVVVGSTFARNSAAYGGGTSLNGNGIAAGGMEVVSSVYEANEGEHGAATDVFLGAQVTLVDTWLEANLGERGTLYLSDDGALTASGATLVDNALPDVTIELSTGESAQFSGLGPDFTCVAQDLTCL